MRLSLRGRRISWPRAGQRRSPGDCIGDICKRKRPDQGVRTMCVRKQLLSYFQGASSFRVHPERRDSLLDLLQGEQDGGLQFGLGGFVGEAVQAGGGLLGEGADFTEGVDGTGLNFQDGIACRFG